MVYINRVEHFNAAHRVYNPTWSDETNTEVFGSCANKYYHGHNFELVITVKGEPNPDTGYVMDMKRLGVLTKKHVIDLVDHRNLNMDVAFMAGKIPSCEVFVIEIWKILAPLIHEATNGSAILHALKLVETPKNYVEYYG